MLQQQVQAQMQIQQYDQFAVQASNTATFNPSYYPNPFYHRYVQSPAPFYLTGYTEANGFMEIGDGLGGNNLMMVGNYGVASAGQEGNSPANGATFLYDPIYSQQYAAYSYLQPHQAYYDNNYPIGYSAAPPHNALFDDQQHQFQHHLRLSHPNGDLVTPYSSELGSIDNICGGSSSGGTGTASPAPKEMFLNIDNCSNNLSAAHVRPLDVITPELFQAIHAPTFYKSVINPSQQQSQQVQNPQLQQQFYFPFGESISGPASVYGSAIYPATAPSATTNSSNSNLPMTYIPPINSLSSIASYQPMKQNSLNYSNNQFTAFPQSAPPPKASNSLRTAGSASSGSSYSTGNSKEIIPSVTGPDGQIYQKPSGSYASLITKALKECETGKMTLAGIYDWIKSNYPYYRSAEAAWQNSIRHNLSLNKCFKKVPRPVDDPGKGGFWALDYEYIRNQEMAKRMNNPHVLATDLEHWGNDCDSIEPHAKSSSSESAKEGTHCSSSGAKKRRTTADLESSKLLDIFIPQEGWENSVRAVASVVDEIYAANFEQESLNNAEKEISGKEEKFAEEEIKTDASVAVNLSKRPRRTAALSSSTSNAQSNESSRTREPKPYSSMSTTLKIPTPILPNAISGSTSGTASASRQLQYHQYQPATPLSSGTSSAK